MVKKDYVPETIGGQTYWFTPSLPLVKIGREGVYMLPAYDEFIISYRDRSAVLPVGYQNKTVSSNGVFRPIIVVNGQVAGIWKRKIKRDRVIVETEFFSQPDKAAKSLIEITASQYGRFLEKDTEIVHLRPLALD
jgi:hypothetical protein